jgi:hypothetical protein
MKLIDTAHYEDYGHEWYFQVLSFYSRFALIDGRVQWDEFPVTELFPMLLISFGSRSLTGFSFRWKWFEIKCDFLTFSSRNLIGYKTN